MARASTAAANDSGDIAALFAVPPERFVAARNALAASLKAAGDARESEVRALKRPTPSAWLVNALVRDARKEVDAIFRAGDALHAAQGRVLGGADPSELHDALRAVRDAIAVAMKRARAILAEQRRKPTTDLLRRVTATLRAASLDRRVRDVVLRGELVADPSVDEVEALSDVKVPKRAPAKSPPKREAKPAKRDVAREKREREREERERQRAAREQERAAREQERAERARREKEARERLRAEVEAAETAMVDARRTLANAKADERRARAAAEEAARRVAEAEEALARATSAHTRAKRRLR